MHASLRKMLIWLSVFAIAMAFLESAVVVYLRALFYPEGFSFPLQVSSPAILLTEVGRECATVLMLVAVAALAGRRFNEQFCIFAFCFGVWDIFYYVWLKVLIDWPASLWEWDVLFLIPVTWAGPVLAPVLVSLGLVGAAVLVLRALVAGHSFAFSPLQWTLEILAGLIIIASFVWDYRAIMNQGSPEHFPWALFLCGMMLGLAVFIETYRRMASAGAVPPPG